MKKITALLLCIWLVSGLLAGCAQERQAHIPTGNGLTWDEEETAPAVSTQAEETTQQNIIMAYYPNLSMNPYACMDYTNRALFSLIYQSLFVTDREYEVRPILCQRYRVSEDMMTYTFYLVANACFSDGDRITAEDVAASLQAAMKDGYYAGRFSHVVSIATTADAGVQIQLDTAYEDLTRLLDIPIVKAEQINDNAPLGSGPYVFTQTGPAASLVRSSNWWCQTTLPIQAHTIPLMVAESPVDIRDQFEFSSVSLVCADPGSDSYADYRCDYELWDCENGIFVYLGCNTSSGIFANKTVRSALTYAIDRDYLTDTFYRDFAEGITLPASPSSPYYDETLAAMYAYNRNIFSQAVKKAAVVGQTVKLLINNEDTLRMRTAYAIADMLTECGLAVEVIEKNAADYYTALQYKEYDLYLGQTRLSPNMDLTEFFHEDGKISFGPMNDESIYALCRQALENSGNYYDLHQMIMNDGRLCPILIRSYAIYADRGMIDDLYPARDNIFYYDLGRTLADAAEEEPQAGTTNPPDTTGQSEPLNPPSETTVPDTTGE